MFLAWVLPVPASSLPVCCAKGREAWTWSLSHWNSSNEKIPGYLLLLFRKKNPSCNTYLMKHLLHNTIQPLWKKICLTTQHLPHGKHPSHKHLPQQISACTSKLLFNYPFPCSFIPVWIPFLSNTTGWSCRKRILWTTVNKNNFTDIQFFCTKVQLLSQILHLFYCPSSLCSHILLKLIVTSFCSWDFFKRH